jgi:hypothetical protein
MLKAQGYCAVRVPKADVRPLQVLAESGKDLDRLGELDTLLIASSVSLPRTRDDVPAASVAGRRTSDLKVGIGLSILQAVIAAMGGSTLGLDAVHHDAHTLAFEFIDVLGDSVEVIALDQYLAAADVDPRSKHVAAMLDADQLYVITATLKSRRFAVTTKGSSGGGVELAVPEIQQAVGAKVKVSRSVQTASAVTYEGPVPLVFGFQAIRLSYARGRYETFKSVGPKRVLRGKSQDERHLLTLSAPFARLG